MISMEKKYRTRDGWDVRIFCTDRKSKYGGDGNVVGLIIRDDSDQMASWDLSGSFLCRPHEHRFDLIEVKPRIKRTVWLNIYEDEEHTPAHATADSAMHGRKCVPGRRALACVRVDIDCEEGEGLTPCKPPFPENVRR